MIFEYAMNDLSVFVDFSLRELNDTKHKSYCTICTEFLIA